MHKRFTLIASLAALVAVAIPASAAFAGETVTGPDGNTVSLWADRAYGFFEIFTGDSLPEADRRRTGLGVEPMTCAPDAFNSGDGLVVLRSGETHRAQWGITPE